MANEMTERKTKEGKLEGKTMIPGDIAVKILDKGYHHWDRAMRVYYPLAICSEVFGAIAQNKGLTDSNYGIIPALAFAGLGLYETLKGKKESLRALREHREYVEKTKHGGEFK